MSKQFVNTNRNDPRNRVAAKYFFLMGAALAVCAGCGFFGDSAEPEAGRPAGAIQGEAASLASASQPKDVREAYYVIYLEGAKVGHSQQTSQSQDGGKTVRTEQKTHLKLRRFGQVVSNEMQLTAVETADGKLLRLASKTQLGPTAKLVVGRVEGASLVLEYPGQSNQPSRTVDWTEADGGFFAVERSLKTKPLAAGEERRLRQFSPIIDQVYEVELVGGPRESTQLLDGRYELQRVEMSEKIPLPTAGGAAIHLQTITTTLWCDDQGTIVKTHSDAMQQETFLCDKSVALADFDPRQIDLGTGNVVRLDRPLQNMAGARQASYRILLQGGDADTAFVSEPRQQIQPADDGSFRLVVRRFEPDDPASIGGSADIPTDADLVPSVLIESNAPCIAELAARVAPDEPDSSLLARELASEVDRYMAKKDFSQVFASAAEACQSKQGDCTEHALLLAALCRNRGIPARLAMGLVYMESLQGFAYHMWTEVWTGDRWIGLDATRGGSEVTIGHLKLAHSSLQGTTAYGSFLPMLKVLGKLRLELLEED